MKVNEPELVAGLRSLGLSKSDHIVVHSSLSSLGYVDGGADTVIDALQEVVTPSGTIMMPTYSGQVIYFLETLALGKDPGGKVFSGDAEELWRLLRTVSEDSGIEYPFGSPEEMIRRLESESKRLTESCGWEITLSADGTDNPRIELRRNGPRPDPQAVKPWKMPVWTGAIPDSFWKREETIRSHQYSGSFTAWGRHAIDLTEGHDNRPGQGTRDHPLYRLKELGGKVLLLGVDHTRNSMIHVAQWSAFEKLDRELPPHWREFMDDFRQVEGPLDECGGQEKGKVGDALCRLCDARALFEVVADLLRQRAEAELGR